MMPDNGDDDSGPLRIRLRPDAPPEAACITFDILGHWEERWEFAGACDALSRAIALRTFFALREDAPLFIHAEINCQMHRRRLAGWGIDESEMAHVIRCVESIGRARGEAWQRQNPSGCPS